ncbi:MAG: MetQ/NlpA family ABC transporter substrate-binding protein [Clostridiales bacterium]|nr:MetQ/NlpA family ABC transporter substrate-binding protein [Clostridiales bacterium]
MNKKNILTLGLTAALTLSLAACGGDSAQSAAPSDAAESAAVESAAPAEPTVVTVGVVGANNGQWDTVNELLADDNIKVELVEFSEYKLPNEALNAGEIDMNAFQHKAYFNNECESYGYDLSILGDTIIAPLSLYSDKISSVDELKEGDKIAVPSDPTNEGRCFKILESAGVLEVDPAAGYVPELKDITSNPLNLEFVEVEAANTASLLPDVAAAFVNGAHAVDNGLNLDDAIYTEQVEPGSDNPYINILAVRTADLENETYQKVLEAYQSAETAQAILDLFKGTYIPAFEY